LDWRHTKRHLTARTAARCASSGNRRIAATCASYKETEPKPHGVRSGP